MPYEIFISYRRSDAAGHAGRLHDRLTRHFDTDRIFYDLESITWGEEFQDGIAAAVRECKVLLALIAGDWLTVKDQAGNRRLDLPTDVVRGEIALALAEGKKVIPVLLGGAAPLSADDLPEPIAKLAGRDMAQLGGKGFEYDQQFEVLVRLIASVAGVTPPVWPKKPQTGSLALKVPPDDLPCLCDRDGQETVVRRVLRAHVRAQSSRPIVLLLHGNSDERHDLFITRLRGRVLPEIFASVAANAPVKLLEITQKPALGGAPADFEADLRERLGERLGADAVQDADLLDETRRQSLAALFSVVKLGSGEIVGDASVPLRWLFDYWAKFPDSGGRPIVGCILRVSYTTAGTGARSGWLGRLLGGKSQPNELLRNAVNASADLHRDDPRVAWHVLAELPSVGVEDLDRWVDAAQPWVDRTTATQAKLRAIIGEADARPMEAVCPELQKLIEPQ